MQRPDDRRLETAQRLQAHHDRHPVQVDDVGCEKGHLGAKSVRQKGGGKRAAHLCGRDAEEDFLQGGPGETERLGRGGGGAVHVGAVAEPALHHEPRVGARRTQAVEQAHRRPGRPPLDVRAVDELDLHRVQNPLSLSAKSRTGQSRTRWRGIWYGSVQRCACPAKLAAALAKPDSRQSATLSPV